MRNLAESAARNNIPPRQDSDQPVPFTFEMFPLLLSGGKVQVSENVLPVGNTEHFQ